MIVVKVGSIVVITEVQSIRIMPITWSYKDSKLIAARTMHTRRNGSSAINAPPSEKLNHDNPRHATLALLSDRIKSLRQLVLRCPV